MGDKNEHHLNYSERKPEIYCFKENIKNDGFRESKTKITSKDVKNTNMIIISIKTYSLPYFQHTKL